MKQSTNMVKLLVGGLVGAAGGVLIGLMQMHSLALAIVLGGVYGVLFAFLVSEQATSPGSGLLWGLGYAFILWLAVPVGAYSLCCRMK